MNLEDLLLNMYMNVHVVALMANVLLSLVELCVDVLLLEIFNRGFGTSKGTLFKRVCISS